MLIPVKKSISINKSKSFLFNEKGKIFIIQISVKIYKLNVNIK